MAIKQLRCVALWKTSCLAFPERQWSFQESLAIRAFILMFAWQPDRRLEVMFKTVITVWQNHNWTQWRIPHRREHDAAKWWRLRHRRQFNFHFITINRRSAVNRVAALCPEWHLQTVHFIIIWPNNVIVELTKICSAITRSHTGNGLRNQQRHYRQCISPRRTEDHPWIPKNDAASNSKLLTTNATTIEYWSISNRELTATFNHSSLQSTWRVQASTRLCELFPTIPSVRHRTVASETYHFWEILGLWLTRYCSSRQPAIATILSFSEYFH